jgi:hypothetical protein
MRLPKERRTLRLLPVSLILGVCLYSIFFWLVKPLIRPAPGNYAEAGQLIRSQWRQGDIIAIRPWWAARIREHVGDLTFLQVRDLASEDLSTHARLWVVLLPGYDDDLHEKHELEDESPAGRLTVRRYRLPEPVPILYDFQEQLRRAQVRMYQGKSAKPCSRWVENRWVCTNRDWNYVGRMVVELGDDPRAVLWAHPSDTGPIEITYPDVPGGKTLLVHTGLTPQAARTPGGAPVTLEVRLNGHLLGRVVRPADQSGYFPTSWDISGHGPGPHTVTFRVSAPHVGMRHYCFNGEVRG